MSGDRQYQPGGEPAGRTWLEAALAVPDRFVKPRPVRARVYRTPAHPPQIEPRWHWSCPACDMGGGHNCLHDLIHQPGTWTSAMCGALHHIHTRHPRRPATQGEHPHDTLGSRRRCDWSPPNDHELRLATLVLCGRTGYPRGDRAREMAREVLALAGRWSPGAP